MAAAGPGRSIIRDGPNTEKALKVLGSEVPRESLEPIRDAAARVVGLSVDPIDGPPSEPSDGLLYGLIQSGKTGVMTVSAAMAVDNGFQGLIVLTSDNDELYDQTIGRVQRGLRGVTVLGKRDWRDPARFARKLRNPPFAIVCSKNGPMLTSLLEAFKNARCKGLSLFIIDDEADQASLNRNARRPASPASTINRVITEIRDYFPTNTYLQVTATPQALFLQRPNQRYHPSFTVLTEPGPGYVGGNEFFGPNSSLLRPVPLAEVQSLVVRNQPRPSGRLPDGLRAALCTFLVAAGAKLEAYPDESFAFLCHVSLSNADQAHIVTLIERFKDEVSNTLQAKGTAKYTALLKELKAAYTDLSATDPNLPTPAVIEQNIEFFIRGSGIKLVNTPGGDDIGLDAALNFIVGGSKLGRGVTIRNLLVSYYGRNPARPNSDTVLQHARMYGYRARDVGVTRLFLPTQLADNFRSIHQMEAAMRDFIREHPGGRFEGLFVRTPLQATRREVLDPATIGTYVAGRGYNPRRPLRTANSAKHTLTLDQRFSAIGENEGPHQISFDEVIEILRLCSPDPAYPSRLWNVKTFQAALEALKTTTGQDRAYLVVRRNRNLVAARDESQGILDSGEEALAARDKPTLFMIRQNDTRNGELAVWWPQLRFARGNYVIAFSVNT